MKLQIFVILVVGLFWGASFSSAQPQGEPCKCADRDTLLNALNVSQAAIQELNSQLSIGIPGRQLTAKHFIPMS